MAQPAGHDFDVDPGPQQSGGVGMARVVKADLWQARAPDCPREPLGHVLRDQRPTDVVSEDVALSAPEAGCTGKLPGVLALLVLSEEGDRGLVEPDRPLPGARFRS